MGLDQAAAGAIVGLGRTVDPMADLVARRYCPPHDRRLGHNQVDPKLLQEPGGGAGISNLGWACAHRSDGGGGTRPPPLQHPKFSAPPAWMAPRRAAAACRAGRSLPNSRPASHLGNE